MLAWSLSREERLESHAAELRSCGVPKVCTRATSCPLFSVLTVRPQIVTCLRMQHRAAPTEHIVFSALRVGSVDKSAEPSLKAGDRWHGWAVPPQFLQITASFTWRAETSSLGATSSRLSRRMEPAFVYFNANEPKRPGPFLELVDTHFIAGSLNSPPYGDGSGVVRPARRDRHRPGGGRFP